MDVWFGHTQRGISDALSARAERLYNESRMMHEDLNYLVEKRNMWQERAIDAMNRHIDTREHLVVALNQRNHIRERLMHLIDRFEAHRPFNRRCAAMRSIINELCDVHNSLCSDREESSEAESEEESSKEEGQFYGPVDTRGWSAERIHRLNEAIGFPNDEEPHYGPIDTRSWDPAAVRVFNNTNYPGQ